MHLCGHVHVHRHPLTPSYTTMLPTPSSNNPCPPGVPFKSGKSHGNWMNWDISILFEDFWFLQPCVLIQVTYGVQLGGVPSQIAFFTFEPKMYTFFAPVSPQLKISCFHTGIWYTMFRLTTDMLFDLWPIYNPFKLQLKWRHKCKVWFRHQFYYRTINHRKICNAPFDFPMCSL